MFYLYEKPIISITGTAGKTTVKSLVSAILRERWMIFESKDYNNTTQQTKQHAQQISDIHRAVVLEYGMAYPGVISEHCRIIRPNIGVITNVGYAHIKNFNGSLEQLIKAKSELIKGMNPKGILFINGDDINSKLLYTHGFPGRIYTVGIDSGADYQGISVKLSARGTTFKLIIRGGEYNFSVPLLGKHNVYNTLFAIGIADQLGFHPDEIQEGIEKIIKPNHRLDIYQLKEKITVIDDTVHAHPTAMKAALDVFEIIEGDKKIAILGNMPELGEYIDEYHRKIGRYASTKKIDYLFTYGHTAAQIGTGAIDAGFPANRVKHKTPLDRKALHQELTKIIGPGTTVLVKGASRLNMFETVKFLYDYYTPE